MTDRDQDIEARLTRLARSTEAVVPSEWFTDRVMVAIDSKREPEWNSTIVRMSRVALPVAALAASIALMWAVASEHTWEEALAVSSGQTELEW